MHAERLETIRRQIYESCMTDIYDLSEGAEMSETMNATNDGGGSKCGYWIHKRAFFCAT